MTTLPTTPPVETVAGDVRVTVPRDVVADILTDIAHRVLDDPGIREAFSDLGETAERLDTGDLTDETRANVERCRDDAVRVLLMFLPTYSLDLAKPTALDLAELLHAAGTYDYRRTA